VSAPRPQGERLALFYGYSLPEREHPIEGERVEVDAGGVFPVEAIDGGEIVAIPRHGFDRSIPAHLVDHRANVRAACELGCDRVVALGSVGSLRRDCPVGSLVCPDDFYAPGVGPSFYEDPRGHSVAGFDREWRRSVISAWDSLAGEALIDGGVYAQTRGPRFETPAEVRALARSADMVGMTLAGELMLAGEAALAYAAVCTVDNLANGLEGEALTVDEYRRGRDRTGRAVLEALEVVIPALARELPGT
jgi:5'-methylthioinosine phosphorylase